MNELEINDIKIEDVIYEIRGIYVMLDSDLAILYNVETKRINEAVNRNKEKFPNRFSWILTDHEEHVLRSHFATSKINTLGGRRYKYRVFTEQGIAMLATILKSKIATEISIAIMDAFVLMRKYIANNHYNQRLNNVESEIIEHNKEIKLLQDSFNKLEENIKNNHIFFEGQIYDAYSLLIDLLNEAKEEIVIIDNYVGKELFDILKAINKTIKIVTKNIDELAIKNTKVSIKISK